MTATIHVVPVGVSLWHNIDETPTPGNRPGAKVGGARSLYQFLNNHIYDDTLPLTIAEVAELLRPMAFVGGGQQHKKSVADAFATLSAETTSLHLDLDARPARFGPDDHVLLLTSQTRAGLRCAAGVATAIRDFAHYRHPTDPAWAPLGDRWRYLTAEADTPCHTEEGPLLDRITNPGGTLIVLDGLTMRDPAGYRQARRALGGIAANLLITANWGSTLRLHLNGGFKALLPPLLTAAQLISSLTTTTPVTAAVAPQADGFTAASNSLDIPITRQFGLSPLRGALTRDTLAITKAVNDLGGQDNLGDELAGLLDHLINGTARTWLGEQLLSPQQPATPPPGATG